MNLQKSMSEQPIDTTAEDKTWFPINKTKFVLKIKKELPENPSFNDLALWILSRKPLTISQKDYAELPVQLQGLFEIKK